MSSFRRRITHYVYNSGETSDANDAASNDNSDLIDQRNLLLYDILELLLLFLLHKDINK